MTGHIFIYGGIGPGPGEVSLNNVKSQIDPKATNYTVHIVSPGGDVFEGYGIYNILKNTGKPVTTHIEGLCASIATLIAFAGEKIIMNKTSEFMIHNPKIADLRGESNDLRNVADQLDKIKSLLIDVSGARAARNGKPMTKQQLWQLYDNETWLTSHEAAQYGFVDEVVDAIKAVAKVDLTKIKQEMEEQKSKGLWASIQNLFKLTKFKNEFTETTADGVTIIVMSEDEDWAGKQVILEDGSPAPDGTHVLQSGKTITVEGGVITQVSASEEAPAEDKQNEEMDNRIAELEAQLAEAKAAKEQALASVQAAEAKAANAEAKAAKFENRVAAIEKDFLKLKEEAGKTVGEITEPAKGPVFKNADEKQHDPMLDVMAEQLGTAYITSRPSNNYNRK